MTEQNLRAKLKHLLRYKPIGWHEGRTIRHRSTTDDDIIKWFRALYELVDDDKLKEDVISTLIELATDTAVLSFHDTNHSLYRKLIEFGSDAIDVLINHLRYDIDLLCPSRGPRGLWWAIIALTELTQQNPIKEGHAGNLKEIISDWLEWDDQNRPKINNKQSIFHWPLNDRRVSHLNEEVRFNLDWSKLEPKYQQIVEAFCEAESNLEILGDVITTEDENAAGLLGSITLSQMELNFIATVNTHFVEYLLKQLKQNSSSIEDGTHAMFIQQRKDIDFERRLDDVSKIKETLENQPEIVSFELKDMLKVTTTPSSREDVDKIYNLEKELIAKFPHINFDFSFSFKED